MVGITRIPHDATGSTPAPVASERVVTGAPMQTIANAYSDAGNAFHCGIWEGGMGAWRVSYSEHEFCHLLAGCVRLIGDDGSETTLRAGDSFVIPPVSKAYGRYWNPRANSMRYTNPEPDDGHALG